MALFSLTQNIFVGSEIRCWSDGLIFVHNLFYNTQIVHRKSGRKVPWYKPHSTVEAGRAGIMLRDEQWVNNIFIAGSGLKPAPQNRPGYVMNHNVYLDGAAKHPLLDKASITSAMPSGSQFQPGPQGVTLKFNLDSDIFKATYPGISSAFIGKLPFPKMTIETPDGKPLDIAADYYGKPIKPKRIMPGPLQGINAGTNTFRLSPKSNRPGAVDESASTSASKVTLEGKHLFILSGQSNMVGLDPRISFTPVVVKAFGQDRVLIVKDAHSGQSIRSWCKSNHEFPPPTTGRVPKVRGNLYHPLMKKVQAAIEGENIQTITFVWMQGESDLNNTAYDVYLKELLKQLQEDLEFKDINFVIGRISDCGLDRKKRLEGKKYIRRTQVQFAKSYPRGLGWTQMISTTGNKATKLSTICITLLKATNSLVSVLQNKQSD